MDSTSMIQPKRHHSSQQKSLLAILKPTVSSPPQKSSRTTTNSQSFVVKFNSELQKSHETEYRSKNSHLFTWNQTFQHQGKLKFLPSQKHLMSQTHMVGKDETTEIMGTNEHSLNNPPINTQPGSIKEIDNNFDTAQTLKLRKRISKEKFQTNSFTQEYFDELKKSALNEKKKVNLSQREKKSYSVVKLQMDLLNNPSSPLIKKIANLQFMSNQFDRRNFNVNKIINKITAQTDMLDKQGVQDETIKKLKYVVKDVKLKRILKPKTASNSISRPITFNPQKYHDTNSVEMLYSPDNLTSIQNSPPKTALDLNASRNQRSKVVKIGRGTPELETITSQKREDSSIAFHREEFPYSFIDISELSQVLRKVKKLKEKEETNPKQYVQNVERGLKEFDITQDLFWKNEQHFKNTTNANFFVKVQSKIRQPRAIISPPNRTQEDTKENLVASRSKSPEASGENMFQYGKYFKDKYMEKGVYFEVSKDLKERIREFGQDLKESAKKISVIDLKKHIY